MTDSADDRRDGAPMSDGTGTMSVQLVLCVADSVWRAAGHLARVCCMPTAHSHRATRIIAPASMLLLLLAVLSFHSVVTVSPGASETAARDGRRTRIAPASMLLLLLAVLWPIRRTIGVMVRQ